MVCFYIIFGVGKFNWENSWVILGYVRVICELVEIFGDLISVCVIRVSVEIIYDFYETF